MDETFRRLRKWEEEEESHCNHVKNLLITTVRKCSDENGWADIHYVSQFWQDYNTCIDLFDLVAYVTPCYVKCFRRTEPLQCDSQVIYSGWKCCLRVGRPSLHDMHPCPEIQPAFDRHCDFGTVHSEIQKEIRRFSTTPGRTTFCTIQDHDSLILHNLDAFITSSRDTGGSSFKRLASDLCWSFNGKTPSHHMTVRKQSQPSASFLTTSKTLSISSAPSV